MVKDAGKLTCVGDCGPFPGVPDWVLAAALAALFLVAIGLLIRSFRSVRPPRR